MRDYDLGCLKLATSLGAQLELEAPEPLTQKTSYHLLCMKCATKILQTARATALRRQVLCTSHVHGRQKEKTELGSGDHHRPSLLGKVRLVRTAGCSCGLKNVALNSRAHQQ